MDGMWKSLDTQELELRDGFAFQKARVEEMGRNAGGAAGSCNTVENSSPARQGPGGAEPEG